METGKEMERKRNGKGMAWEGKGKDKVWNTIWHTTYWHGMKREWNEKERHGHGKRTEWKKNRKGIGWKIHGMEWNRKEIEKKNKFGYPTAGNRSPKTANFDYR